MSQTKTSTADYCALMLYSFLGLGCFAGIFPHTVQLPEPRQSTWGYLGYDGLILHCGGVHSLVVISLDAPSWKKESGMENIWRKKVNVCGLIGLSKMSGFYNSKAVSSPASKKADRGLLWLMSLLLRAWAGESRLGLPKTRKPTVAWGGLSKAHAQTHFLALLYVMA